MARPIDLDPRVSETPEDEIPSPVLQEPSPLETADFFVEEAGAPHAETSDGSKLGRRTAAGFVWLFAQTVLSKVVGIIGQLLLTRLLAPADFGLFSVAYAVTLGIGWMQQAGIREVLIRRARHYNGWVNAAFWLAVAIGTGGYVLAWMLAPLLERFYAMPHLASLIRVAALSPAFVTVANVAQAKLEIEMRFSALARLNFVMLLVQTVLSVVLARLGAGSYSFVVPIALLSLAGTLYLFWLTRPPLRLDLQWRRWRYFRSGVGFLVLAGACNFALWQGDYIILGRVVSKHELGLYFFAYGLSQQTLTLLTNNINSVLLPALSQLQNDRARQLDVYLRATRSLAVVGTLLCLLPAVMSGALLATFFNPKWAGAAPILTALSIGMAIRVADATSEALLKAQGRFKTLTLSSIAHAATFITLGLFAAHFQGALGMACAVGGCIALFGPLRVYLGVRPLGGRLIDVLGVFGGAFSLFAVSQIVPLLLARKVFPDSHFAAIALPGVLGTTIYFSLLRVLSPALWNDMRSRIKR